MTARITYRLPPPADPPRYCDYCGEERRATHEYAGEHGHYCNFDCFDAAELDPLTGARLEDCDGDD